MFPIWVEEDEPKASRIAVKLATKFFSESVGRISTHYEKIAKQKYLDVVEPKNNLQRGKISKASPELQRFQTTTASICLAILTQLGGTDYHEIQHSTMIDLSGMDHLKWLCGKIDQILSGDGCGFSEVITALAAMHCAASFPTNNFQNDDISTSDSTLVGWRNGKKAILPNLLFDMEAPLVKSALEIRCVDVYIANLPARRDGSIYCPDRLPGALQFSSEFVAQARSDIDDVESQSLALNDPEPIILGQPRLKNPDKPLYISLERPPYGSGEPEISLCGRIDGVSKGNVGIHHILNTLALSWSDEHGFPYNICKSGHQPPNKTSTKDQLPAKQVFNMPASLYCGDSGITPRCSSVQNPQAPRHHVYVQVEGDTPWTIFLAGQSAIFNRVSFGCPECAVNTGANCISSVSNGLRTIIGYQ